MAAPPAKAEISAPFPNPSNSVARLGFSRFYDYVTGLLGMTGNASDARTALGVPAANDATLTGNPTATTQASSDNSTRIATTAWAKLGFAASLGANGYLKLPTWLGAFIFQWGGVNTTTSGATVTFPLAWPAGAKGIWLTPQVAGARSVSYQSLTGTSVFVQAWDIGGGQQANFISWFSVGT